MSIEIQVGQNVQWFPQADKGNVARGGMVIEVGSQGMVTIACPQINGSNEIHMMIRHFSDPALKLYPHIKMESGAWDFVPLLGPCSDPHDEPDSVEFTERRGPGRPRKAAEAV
mgnify:CR=1 FL=1